jgi:hypothetical protein
MSQSAHSHGQAKEGEWMPMPAVIDPQTRNYIIHGLAEGLSIRSLERMYGTNKETILRYQLLVGKGCHFLMDAVMRDLDIESIQVDEFWSYIWKKQARVNRRKRSGIDHEGDIWTYVALAPKSKLVPCYWIGQRERYDSRTFMQDLAGRLRNRIQLSSDGLQSYADAVDNAFGAEIDYGQIVKIFTAPPDPNPTRGHWGPPGGDFRAPTGHQHQPDRKAESYRPDAYPQDQPGHQCLFQETGQLPGRGGAPLCLL